ncbi:MAG: hypothetical protein ACXVCY_00625 [Pseudobdellovibrionaceae bacterium]
MRSGLLIVAALMFFLSKPVYAQQGELIDRNFSGVSKQTIPLEAKKDIQDQASQKISEDIIKELIGEERFAKNKSRIQTAIIKNSARYIPFSKPSQIVQEGDEFKMSVEMKVSLRDLKQMLQNNALLTENEAVPVVLPMISWLDRIQGRSFRWWVPSDKTQQAFLIKEGRLFEDALRNSFKRDNFFVVKPLDGDLGLSVPSDFQNEKLSADDLQFFAQYFNAPVLLDGQILLNKGDRGNNIRIEIRLNAVQVSNGRAIADVSRSFETEPGTFESVVDKKLRGVVEQTANDLASQVLDAWQKGTLGSSVIRLTIKGVHSLPSIESLKEKIRSQVSQIKSIHERFISSEAVGFEVDASIAVSELANKLATLDFGGKKLTKVSEGRDEIVFTEAQ